MVSLAAIGADVDRRQCPHMKLRKSNTLSTMLAFCWMMSANSFEYRKHKADRIIAEVNNGGAMVEATIRAIDSRVSYRSVHASRGKVVRAEPIAALYEQRRVHHVGTFTALEDQMCAFTSDFDRSRAGYAPDRVDALVWALTELSGPRNTVIVSPLPF
jgi:phage terminase large subunit-like protein